MTQMRILIKFCLFFFIVVWFFAIVPLRSSSEPINQRAKLFGVGVRTNKAKWYEKKQKLVDLMKIVKVGVE